MAKFHDLTFRDIFERPSPGRARECIDVVHDCGITRTDLDSLYPFVFRKPGRKNNVLVLDLPSRGNLEGFGIWRITSGLPIFHPSSNFTGLGASPGFPSGAPVSAQETKDLISSSERDRSFENLPCCGSAPHGGIFFCTTAVRIAFAQGRTCS